MKDIKTKQESLDSNWEFVQEKINDIKSHRNIDIKQISDMQRYVEMQKNIAKSSYHLKAGRLLNGEPS
ncbi:MULTISPECIES: hypothetical protein [Bacillus]|uniref:hypothetical protein n=1 Tax=Bacillus TaxID=1386 RepID=UPI000BF97616|nr:MULTISPECIES: hypothetical protein [Bacillus]MCP1324249.1 hypothetical protein [Bacillus sp. S0628]PGA25330.1 hypothetical protein COL80_15695 [Bacillus thuringiensis]